MLRLVIVFLLIDDIGASGERTSHNEGQQLADFSPEATYESLQFQYMANSGSIDHLYLEEPIVFDESPQFETIAVDKSQAGNKDAILDQARAKPDLIPQDSFENADKEYNEVEHPDTCISNDCALDATLDSRFLTNSNSSPQDNKDSNQNSRFPSNTFLVPIFSELTEGSGDMHKQLPDRNDTDLESQRIISLEIEGITERYKSLVIPPSKENQPENSLTTFHTLNPWPALGFATPTKSNIGFQEPKSPVDELLVDSRRENYNKTIPERTSTRTRIASNDHWPNKPVMVPELNIDQSSNDSQIVCNPGYIHENNSCWSICEVIPDYCFNGGKCGVIENIGVFCSKLWISSTPHINSSFLSEICQQGDCSPLASHAPNSQSTLLGENHLTQGSFKSQQDVQKEALTRSPDEDMALNIQNTGISKCNENAETDHDLCVLWRTERTAV
ncbi:uncharacterized protein LOC122539684 isoform X4 [Chiloscyllium plagiosum]|uniref:uncharacterized protein LOC122539684 isoform X4 n=1 Tax=Chiloscyllium plagiosum TaxID=36176 RepID=UPI001CB8235A|nr:uncharacterized protein LOC122539684 isoform X4 [Chiloscyllium plagiosum]